ncbi:MAG: shikimate dehydrogenase [Candidatus Thermoplasmatota archaeon]|nr:shikimate dehydrogenase [Candidatus Thermoplasmatota archaeon]
MQDKKLFCLIGDPVSHSISPSMQNYAFKRSGLEAVYIAIRVKQADLGRYIGILKELDAKGMNVTMPHKIEVIGYLDELDKTAEKIGAVNTVVNENGTLKGYNTDASGVLEAMREAEGDFKGKRAIILGRGGMAKAVSFVLEEGGAETRMLGRKEMKEEIIEKELKNSDIVCNCTPVGMNGEPSPIPERLIQRNVLVVDAAYGFHKTNLIKEAERKGNRTVTGLQLLVRQGANSFRLWTGLDPDRKGMMASALSRISDMKRGGLGNIYLIGFAGSGKSSSGRLIAKFLKREFVDTDDQISRELGIPAWKIIDDKGEYEFRKMERCVIESISKRKNAVVATGGGAVLSYGNICNMKQSGSIILLNVSPSTVMERLDGDSSHPLLRGMDGKTDPQKVIELIANRKCYYDIAKDAEVETDGKGIDDLAQELVRVAGGLE